MRIETDEGIVNTYGGSIWDLFHVLLPRIIITLNSQQPPLLREYFLLVSIKRQSNSSRQDVFIQKNNHTQALFLDSCGLIRLLFL